MLTNKHLGNGRAKANGRIKQRDQSALGAGYNEFKEFEGKKYTGMKVGRGHKWYYDKGEWKEKKLTPDKWEFTYSVAKRRAGKAPEGSGVPVGTEYHWYILAHQTVRKLNANDYATSMTGLKFKVAHKRADKDKWSASARAQRNRLIKILKEVVQNLEEQQLDEKRSARKRASSGDGVSALQSRKRTSRGKKRALAVA